MRIPDENQSADNPVEDRVKEAKGKYKEFIDKCFSEDSSGNPFEGEGYADPMCVPSKENGGPAPGVVPVGVDGEADEENGSIAVHYLYDRFAAYWGDTFLADSHVQAVSRDFSQIASSKLGFDRGISEVNRHFKQ